MSLCCCMLSRCWHQFIMLDVVQRQSTHAHQRTTTQRHNNTATHCTHSTQQPGPCNDNTTQHTLSRHTSPIAALGTLGSLRSPKALRLRMGPAASAHPVGPAEAQAERLSGLRVSSWVVVPSAHVSAPRGRLVTCRPDAPALRTLPLSRWAPYASAVFPSVTLPAAPTLRSACARRTGIPPAGGHRA